MTDVKMTEEEWDARLNREIKVGESSGLKQAAGLLMQRATEAFQGGFPEATILRSIAEELRKMGDERHPLTRCKKCDYQHYPEDKCVKKRG